MQFATMQHFTISQCLQTLDSQINTGDGSSLAPSPPYAISCFFHAKHLAKMPKTTCCLAFFNVFFHSFQRDEFSNLIYTHINMHKKKGTSTKRCSLLSKNIILKKNYQEIVMINLQIDQNRTTTLLLHLHRTSLRHPHRQWMSLQSVSHNT